MISVSIMAARGTSVRESRISQLSPRRSSCWAGRTAAVSSVPRGRAEFEPLPGVWLRGNPGDEVLRGVRDSARPGAVYCLLRAELLRRGRGGGARYRE